MPKKTKKHIVKKVVLRLSDLDHAKSSVLNSLSSSRLRRNYKFAMEQFIAWYCSEPRLALNRTVVLRFRLYQESLGLAAGTINQRLAAVRRLAYAQIQRRCGIGGWSLCVLGRVTMVCGVDGEVPGKGAAERFVGGDEDAQALVDLAVHALLALLNRKLRNQADADAKQRDDGETQQGGDERVLRSTRLAQQTSSSSAISLPLRSETALTTIYEDA